jgi:hypothetical protein
MERSPLAARVGSWHLYSKKLRACLISELYKAWPESQALASHSQALEDSCLCLIQLHQMIQAQQRT